MKRVGVISATVFALLAACLAPIRATASPLDPGAFAAAEQMAEADWMDLKNKTFYFATGWRDIQPEAGLVTLGFVGKGTCHVNRDGNFTIVFCAGSATGHEIATEDFEFDPAMASASLTLKTKGTTHTVEWTGEGAPSYGASVGGGGLGVQAGGGSARYAPAVGHIFGKDLEPSRNDFGVLLQDAAIAAFADSRSMRYEDGVLTIHVRYRIPR